MKLDVTEIDAVIKTESIEINADFFRRRKLEDFCLTSKWLMSLSFCSKYSSNQCSVFVQYNMRFFWSSTLFVFFCSIELSITVLSRLCRVRLRKASVSPNFEIFKRCFFFPICWTGKGCWTNFQDCLHRLRSTICSNFNVRDRFRVAAFWTKNVFVWLRLSVRRRKFFRNELLSTIDF